MTEQSERIIADLVDKTIAMNDVIEALAKRVAVLESLAYAGRYLKGGD